jgi:hypothetical protein
MQKSPFFFRHLSLRWLLIVPFVVQIVGAVGLVAYLSYRVGQKSVAASVNHLMAETKEHVIEHLDSYLDIAQKVNQSNRDLIGSGLIDVNNFRIIDVGNPSLSTDAANKSYVDNVTKTTS